MRSRRQNLDTDLSVHFGNDSISPSHSVKVLGVVIDSHLTWEAHVSSIVRRCYCVLVGLARMRHRLPKCTRRMLVEALVFPHLRYCVTVWGSCSACQRKRIQRAIHFGVRIVAGLGRRDHVTPSLRELGWCNVDELITERDIATIRHLIAAPNASELLRDRIIRRSDVSARVTRATVDGQLQLPRVRTEFARRSFLYRAVTAWNGLPLDARQPPAIRDPHH